MRQALFATLLAPLVLAATPVLAADLPRALPRPRTIIRQGRSPIGKVSTPASTAALALPPSPTAPIRCSPIQPEA